MKRYLVPYDGSALSKSALLYAVEFARCVRGVIDIVYIADSRTLSNPLLDTIVATLQGFGALGDYLPREKAVLELKAKLVSRGEEILRELVKWDEFESRIGEIKYSTRVETANPPKLIIDVSENYDVIFMGLWGEMHNYKADKMWGGTSEAVIRKGVSPVFLATEEFRKVDIIIVGFDNRPRSRQALAWAGMLGETLNVPVISIISGRDKEWLEEVAGEADEIAQSYDTDFTYEPTDKQPAERILEESSAHPNALVCLGAFGDEPIRELFLGSVAEEVLRKASNPVMLLK